MITNLRIQNVALIEEVEVDFASGLNILTGETGAGKSILVDSINFLLGGRLGREFIRSGADFAHVEGIVEFSGSGTDFEPIKENLNNLGIDTGEGQIMLARTIQASTGKSTCRINGRTVTTGILKDAATMLVDLHGQNEHQSLIDPVKQLQLLDGFCDAELTGLKVELETKLGLYKEANKALKALTGIGNQRQEKIDMWRFQLEEIERAALKPNDEEELTARKNRLIGLEKLSKCTSAALALLDGGTEDESGQISATDQTSRALTLLADLAKLDPAQQSLYEHLMDVSSQLTDITLKLHNYMDELDADPQELEQTESRLDTIYRLKKKYGSSVEAILQKQDELVRNLDHLENSGGEIKRLTAVRRGIITEVTALCDKMNALRTASATRISGEISDILHDLGMQNARFFIDVTRKTAFGPDGNDQIEFMISTNPGEPAKQLRRIASGGEMSRVMLAIKTVMADNVSTVIFDEVDTGISGRTAQQVAEKLMVVSRRRQILCITHLPQIAAMADTHFLIRKSTDAINGERRTNTTVKALTHELTTLELARLIGGAQITAATLEAAKEMKEQASGLKKII